MDLGNDERRRSQRIATDWSAECRLGGLRSDGVIRDISEDGAFVALGVPVATVRPPPGTPFAELVEVGDQFVLSYRRYPSESLVQAIGTLRWAGYNPTHRCRGLGVEFEAA